MMRKKNVRLVLKIVLLTSLFFALSVCSSALVPQNEFIQYEDDFNDSSFNQNGTMWDAPGGAPTEDNKNIIVGPTNDFWSKQNFTAGTATIVMEYFAWQNTGDNIFGFAGNNTNVAPAHFGCAFLARGPAGNNLIYYNNDGSSASFGAISEPNGTYFQVVLNFSNGPRCQLWVSNESIEVQQVKRHKYEDRGITTWSNASKMTIGMFAATSPISLNALKVFNMSLYVAPIVPTDFFDLTANDSTQNTSLLNFFATINGTNYTTSNGSVNTNINQSIPGTINLTVYADGFIPFNVLNHNSSVDLEVQMIPAAHLKAQNLWNSTFLNNFSVYIGPDSYSTLNGTVQTNIAYNNTSLFNITFEAADHFNSTFYNVNVTQNYTGQLFQTILRIFAHSSVSNASILDFNVSFTTTNNTTSAGVLVFNPNSGTYTFNVTADGYGNLTQNLTLNILDNITLNVSFNPLINFSILDENDGFPFNVNVTDLTKMTIFCANKSIVQEFDRATNQSSVLIEVDCQWEFIKLDVELNESSYYRTYIPPFDATLVVMYAIDLTTETAVQVKLLLNDLVGDFVDGTAVIKRFVNGTQEEVIQQKWDIENKVDLFLIKNAVYTLSLIGADGIEKAIGDFIADSAGEKTVTVPEIPFIPESTFGNDVMWDWNDNISLIKLVYNDTSSERTASLNFTVYNGSNLSQIVYSTSSTNVSMASFTYITLQNESYLSCFAAYKTSAGNFGECKQYWLGQNILSLDAFDPADAAKYTNWICIFVFVLVIWIGKRFIGVVMALDAFLMFFAIRIGWFTYGNAVIDYTILSIWTFLTVLVFIIGAWRR